MYPVAINENERLDILRGLGILDTPSHRAIDAICVHAQRIFRTPIALVSLVEQDRQWFKARCGLAATETSREVSFCSYAILNDEVMVVEDALADDRFAQNPLVLGPPNIRFYAGAPLIVGPGIRIGTLCIIDTAPKAFSAADCEMLAELASVATDLITSYHDKKAAQLELETRRKIEGMLCAERDRAMHSETLLREVIETLPDAVVAFDAQDRLILFNSAYRRYYDKSSSAIRIGARFEEILRFGLANGQYADAGQTAAEREAWLADRLKIHRGGSVCSLVQRLDDGRWLQVTERRSESGHFVGIRTDVTELKLAELKVRRTAETDALTGLANRDVLWRGLEAAINGRRSSDASGILVLLDIDHFKAINDGLGHDAGDALLEVIAERLKAAVRDTDLVARLGGDEFAVLITGIEADAAADRIVGKIHERLTEATTIRGKFMRPGVSIGVAFFPADGMTPADLFKNADVALYKTKQGGRNGWSFFDPLLRSRIERRRFLAERLRQALSSDELTVALQQQIRVADHSHLGFEALARWSVDGTPVSPAEFIDVAEDAGLGFEVGAALFERAMALFASLEQTGRDAGRLSVNVGMSQLLQGDLPHLVTEKLQRYDIRPERLEIEITESVLLDRHAEQVADTLDRLRRIGVGIALDDFGTGYASLAHLKRVPVDRLKIDQSFIRGVETGNGDAAIVKAIIGLAHSLHLEVVAEGVESAEQLEFLRSCGCEVVQGYLIARPTSSVSDLRFQIARPAAHLGKKVRYYRGAMIA